MDPRVAANRALWNEWTPIHVRSAFYDVEGWKSGLRIEYLHEHPWVPWKMFPFMVETEPSSGVWRLPEPDDARLPLLYSLKATRD